MEPIDSEPEPLPEPGVDEPPITKEPILRGKSRSAKDSILKKLPKPAPKSVAAMRGPRSSGKLFEARPKAPPPRVRVPSAVPTTGLLLLSLLAFILIGGSAALFLFSQVPGYKSNVAVTQPTRLDWTFVEGRRSLDKPRAEHSMYDPNRGGFELYIPPPRPDAAEPAPPLPAVVFLSGDRKAAGWSSWREVCINHGVAYVSPHNAGDDRPIWERARATLDALDQVRREHKLDPERTYIVGQGGGARVACKIAFALPELFGGVVGIGGGALPRDELWLRQRMVDRLSVGWVIGGRDPSLPEVERLLTPLYTQLKVRTHTWSLPNLARSMPPTSTLDEVYLWLDDKEAIAQRRQLAAAYGAASMPPDAGWTQAEWAQKLLEEAQLRVSKPETYTVGTAQLGGIAERWEGLAEANAAQRLYQELLQKDKQTLVNEIKVRHLQDLAIARALTAYLTGPLDFNDMVRNGWQFERFQLWHGEAADLWNRIIANRPGEAEENEAAAALERLRAARALGAESGAAPKP